jgi:hypothetical protein
MKIEQFNSPEKPVLVDDKSRVSSSTQPSTENSKVDQIEISPESAELTKAIESVRREIEYSRSIGYIDPPRALSNGKQKSIIKSRVSQLLKSSYSEDMLTQVTDELWKKGGYRDDNSPLPNPYNDGYYMGDFLSHKDREKIDAAYDEDIANGLSRKEAHTNASKQMRPIAYEKYKAYTIRLGTVWPEGNITSYTREEWDEAVKNRAPEYRDVHGTQGDNATPEDKIKDFQLAQRDSLISQLLSNMNESDEIKKGFKLELEEIADIIMQNLSEQTADDKNS